MDGLQCFAPEINFKIFLKFIIWERNQKDRTALLLFILQITVTARHGAGPGPQEGAWNIAYHGLGSQGAMDGPTQSWGQEPKPSQKLNLGTPV